MAISRIQLPRVPNNRGVGTMCTVSSGTSQSMIKIGGHYFLGSLPSKTDSIKINGTIHTVCSIIKHVEATEAEVQLGVSFNKARIVKRICLTLIELGYPQPPTPLHNDNSIAPGIVKNTSKQQILQEMDTRYLWIVYQIISTNLCSKMGTSI